MDGNNKPVLLFCAPIEHVIWDLVESTSDLLVWDVVGVGWLCQVATQRIES
jgi:hypothetical protein